MKPKISIITVTLNAELFLEQTIQSVIQQTYPLLEYIIIDGQSTDNTLAIIQKYAAHLTWISEPDNGIADAMNKGIALATGELILFIHADDYLLENESIARVINEMKDEYFIWACPVLFQTKNTRFYLFPRSWNAWVKLKNPFCHQGVICKKQLFTTIGIFDIELAITMDYDLFLRAYRRGYFVQLIPFPLAAMRDTGISSKKDWPSLAKRFKEERKVQWKNRSDAIDLLYFLYWPLYWLYRRLRHLLSI